ncbi:tubulin nucleotide-binding domain-like protein [Anaeromyces robustus]|uniref:Tubulin nucleotide-binding domain-like protein n=1 Tax=Anaeromyces robustus TaxID=1754192 RepID=A0A1Y1WUI3_9FUNG|nr:tubulin nucleotide-binding domain-like protein [Anaeromyces robustus]|eukprot:ORX77211.1 tubulin nucleotide-binding domain-like protein [Anaeromyces robustus]
MSQSIFIQVGQCGNQIGWRFWDLALKEHAQVNPKGIYDEAMSSLFRNVDSKTGRDIDPISNLSINAPSTFIKQHKISDLRARCVLIDMEENVINQIKSSPQGFLFRDDQMIMSNSGSGNNWAVGYSEYGTAYHDTLLEAIRRQAETCDSLQSFILCHSIGGGTGSGLGSYLSTQLHDYYPTIYRFSTAIFPNCKDDDVITSPYNSLLSLNTLSESVDCVFPLDNKALTEICERITQKITKASNSYKDSTLKTKMTNNKEIDLLSLKVRETSVQHTIADSFFKQDINLQKNYPKEFKARPFDYMNNIVSQMLLNLTSSVRFPGDLNVDINEISMNLVPFPKLKYIISSLSPLFTISNNSISSSLRNIDQMFSDAFSKDNSLVKADIKNNKFLACALMLRGNVEISDVRRNIEKLKSQLDFIYWNQEGWKTGICSTPSLGQPYSLLALSNNCSVIDTFKDMRKNFIKLYKRKANVHHYTQYIDQDYFQNALNNVNNLIDEYTSLENAIPPSENEMNHWRKSILY